MIELMPKSSVYIYPKDLKVVNKKASGCAKARYLLSAFYTNEELVQAGNVTGANMKKGLNKQVIQAVIGNLFISVIDFYSLWEFNRQGI